MPEMPPTPSPARRKKYVPVVGPRLARLLALIFFLFALLAVNSVYLLSITIAGVEYQNWFYLVMFLAHLLLGLALIVPVVAFGITHIRNARNRPNRRAIRVGYGLFATAILIFLSGFVLTRDLFGFPMDFRSAGFRGAAYWLHVLGFPAVIWLYVLHRLAGRRIKWKVGLRWAAAGGIFAAVMLVVQTQDPRAWNQTGPASGQQYFFPSLSRTSTGDFIPERVLDNDEYCLQCHEEIHDSWSHSVHRFASFNNPIYEFSVKNTRRAMMDRDGTVQGARFCAGCHDPVPFFSGAFDDPRFDDPDYDLSEDPGAQAGITCTVCHSISHVNSPRGNADYTITEPVHYPFTFSESPLLRWVNRQLVKAKPEFHKATFLKPLHQSTEYCGTCHKVHLPPELNAYKWLRGQNHHDAFWLSGVSGQGITSFYYPPKAESNCNGCHMPLSPVEGGENLAARERDDSGRRTVHDHQFPSANTAIPHLLRDAMRDPDGAIAAHHAFNEGVMRLDIFGIREEGRTDGELVAPLRPEVPELEPGGTYLVETVIRTAKMGHLFTQGTVDSNEVWIDVEVLAGERTIGRSGGMEPATREVDPWSHFVNAFVIDRKGNRIDRRNAEDIFIALYNNQIAPGSADVFHGRFTVPEAAEGPIEVRVRLLYRKFDALMMQLVTGDPQHANDLPIMVLAEDSIAFPLRGRPGAARNDAYPVDPWMRWNDYGIGMLSQGLLRQARTAFEQVEALGRPDGPMNLARVAIAEGLVQTEAPDALARAAAFDPPANQWSLLWFGAQVAQRNGDWDRVIANLEDIIRGGFEQAAGRGFDFSKDYRVLDALGLARYQRALRDRGEPRRERMEQAAEAYLAALRWDPENLNAHYGLAQVYRDLGDAEREAHHSAEHERYRPDDNASDEAIASARLKYPAANVAAEDVVIYDLQRPGAPGLPDAEIARDDRSNR